MIEEKFDWEISMKPAEEKGKVQIEGYLTIPHRGKVTFLTIWSMKEFRTLWESVRGSLHDFLTEIAEGEAEQNVTG